MEGSFQQFQNKSGWKSNVKPKCYMNLNTEIVLMEKCQGWHSPGTGKRDPSLIIVSIRLCYCFVLLTYFSFSLCPLSQSLMHTSIHRWSLSTVPGIKVDKIECVWKCLNIKLAWKSHHQKVLGSVPRACMFSVCGFLPGNPVTSHRHECECVWLPCKGLVIF